MELVIFVLLKTKTIKQYIKETIRIKEEPDIKYVI